MQGKGVTHGQQAALFRAGSSVVIKLTSLDPNTIDWLKLDSPTACRWSRR
jgi:hypothetical protein